MRLIDQHRTGLFPEHRTVIPATHRQVRLTVPAREQLEATGGTVTPETPDPILGAPHYMVQLGSRVPTGLVVVSILVAHPDGGWLETIGLRMEHEPPFPGERVADRWTRLAFTPCPKCQAPLVWYEAGYAPGYRVCAGPRHHHFQLSQ